MVDRIRGSIDIPLNPKGRRHALKIGEWFAHSYKKCRIYTSDLQRAVDTAEIISEQTDWPIVEKTEGLQPWHLGILEGQPSKEAVPLMEFLVENKTLPAPGRSKESTKSGESFQTFKDRFFKKFEQIINYWNAHKDEIVVVVTHYRDIALVKEWDKIGSTHNNINKTKDLAESQFTPAAVFQFNPDPAIHMKEMDTNKSMSLPGMIYLVRHGDTEFNG